MTKSVVQMDMFEADTYMELTGNVLSSDHKETPYISSDESLRSCEKVRDVRISDLETKLAMAEDRCTVLRNQVDYMKELYTNNSYMQENAHEEEVEEDKQESLRYEKTEEIVRNSISNASSRYNAKTDDFKRMPANMTVKPLGGTTLTNDPKEAMQMIVNEMTQSVNAMEDGVNIHSNTIEEVLLSSRNRKKRVNREDWSAPRTTRKNQTVATITKKVAITHIQEADRKSLVAKSRTSVNSVRAPKRRPNSKFNVGSKSKVMPKEVQVETKERPKSKPQALQKSGSEAMMPVVGTYLLPTLSYRMKCVPKSHRREFSFHRIPFVLGKSTNKSHNLGAKIQETLSMIKLSRKGLQSTNMRKKEELNNLLHSPSEDVNSQVRPRSTVRSQSNCRPSLTAGATTDYKNYQLRTVLMNLHDEFSKMTESYETLKSSLKEKFDPQVAQSIQNMEEELNAKEIEIDAFMNLYNEVSQLKDKLSSSQSGYPSNAIYRPASSYTESTSTLKMTRLLRRIEEFQTQLKAMSYV